MTMLRDTLLTLRAALILPAILLHEGLHAAVALPFAERVQIEIVPGDALAVHRVQWAADAGRVVRTVATLAPLLAGLVAVSAALWLGLVGVPSTSSELALLAIGAVYWFAAFFSPADLRRAWGGHDG
jgi:hypothetical protein